MTQVLSEGNYNFRDNTLSEKMSPSPGEISYPTTEDIIKIGEDIAFSEPSESIPHYEGHSLVENKIKDLAKIAVLKFPFYDEYRAKAINEVKSEIISGHLTVGTELADLPIDTQAEGFVRTKMMEAYEPYDVAADRLQREEKSLNLGQPDQVSELLFEMNKLKAKLKKKKDQIFHQNIAIRTLLIDGGASEEFIRKFEHVSGIMTQPDQELYEEEIAEMSEDDKTPIVDTKELAIYDAFREIGKHLSAKTLGLVGIHAPQHSVITVVRRIEEVQHL